jgi:RNA polymerase sigma-70 factor (ECF subfamily)
MAQPPEWHPERYRDLVLLWARELHLDPRLQRRFGASDLAQDTMLKAHKKIDEFRGTTEAELLKWLHTILLNHLRDQIAYEKAERRNFELEQALPDVVAESSARIEQWLGAIQSSPSEQAERHEQELGLAAALDQLPEHQRDVIIMHKLMGASVADIASQTGRTVKSVAGLLRRGVQKLGQILKDNQ